MNGKKQEYVILLDLLAKANDSVKESSISDVTERERLLYAHRLAHKFIGHALTVLHLSRGYRVEGLPSFQPANFTDSWSIDVLTRAAMEAFLIFHYVFYAPTTIEEREYRYLTYKVAGIAERQTYLASIFEHEQQKAEEKKVLEELRAKLESNIIFQRLTPKQKTGLFEGKELILWRWNPDVRRVLSWYDIGIDAGFSDMLASHMYGHLSGYAHSSHMSVLQVSQALENKDVDMLVKPSMNTINILMANMIHEYCVLFPEAKVVLEQSGASQFVDMWVSIGCRLDDNLDTGQGK